MSIPSLYSHHSSGPLATLIPEYQAYLVRKNFAASTVKGREALLMDFARFAGERGVFEPGQVTVSYIELYRLNLSRRRNRRTGRPLSPTTQAAHLSALRDYFAFLMQSGKMLFNPAREVALPKIPKRLPRGVLSAKEAEKLVHAPEGVNGPIRVRNRALGELARATGLGANELRALDAGDVLFRAGQVRVRGASEERHLPLDERVRFVLERYLKEVRPKYARGSGDAALFLGSQRPHGRMSADMIRRALRADETQSALKEAIRLRDRAILETLYATGMRRGEAAGLDVSDIRFDSGTIFIRAGKGDVDRVVPAGVRTLGVLGEYCDVSRPVILGGRDDPGALFLSTQGERGRLTVDMVGHVVEQARRAAGIEKEGAAHLLRHTAATLMLEHGADIRYIQQMLGHKRLGTTQKYTHVAIQKLEEVHAKTHPAKFRRPL